MTYQRNVAPGAEGCCQRPGISDSANRKIVVARRHVVPFPAHSIVLPHIPKPKTDYFFNNSYIPHPKRQNATSRCGVLSFKPLALCFLHNHQLYLKQQLALFIAEPYDVQRPAPPGPDQSRQASLAREPNCRYRSKTRQ